jgi:hypothetical protein
VEFFLNFVWVALSLSMIVAWSVGPFSPTRVSRSDWGRQVVALGILLIVLLPVVSLTDDLQSWTAPAEVEHGLRRADITVEANSSVAGPVLWLHFALTSLFPVPGSSSQIELAGDFSKPLMGVSHTLENRPPPASL